MAPLSDPERLLAYRNALSNWKYTGYIRPELTDQRYRWMREELDAIALSEVCQRMYEYVAAGGAIDEVRETRPEWAGKFDHHYDLRFSIQGKPVYVETRLCFHPPFVPDEPFILLVNVHAP